MSNKRVKELKEVLRRAKHMKEDDYFSSSVFYYLAGYYPDMRLGDCSEIISEIRDEIIAGIFFE